MLLHLLKLRLVRPAGILVIPLALFFNIEYVKFDLILHTGCNLPLNQFGFISWNSSFRLISGFFSFEWFSRKPAFGSLPWTSFWTVLLICLVVFDSSRWFFLLFLETFSVDIRAFADQLAKSNWFLAAVNFLWIELSEIPGPLCIVFLWLQFQIFCPDIR